jgi:eukaryotic-like serine/threonine-protein kinase
VSPFSAGQRLNDRYVLIEPIGSGGMAQVWRATDEVLGRPVAVKVLLTAVASDPAQHEATWREARAAGRLTHPHVTRIYDYGEAPLPGDGRAPYLVMELVEGHSVAERLASGPLPWPEAARIAAQVAAALGAAHQIGVVHHDVKPGNIMLTTDGAKVLDFGIAALVGAGHQGWLAGTPTYTAPERLNQAPARPENDLYSLGVLLHEMITGQPPVRLASWEQAQVHHSAPAPAPPDLPGVPDEVAGLLRACLSRDPAARPTARQAATDLASAAGMPDPNPARTVDEPTVLAAGRFAPGSAPLPAPAASPTRVDHGPAVDLEPARPGRRRLLLAGGLLGAVVLVLLLALVLAALRSPGGGSPDAADSPTAPPTSPAPDGPPTEQPDRDDGLRLPGPLQDAPDRLRQFELLIEEALDAERISRDTAHDLLDELEDVWKELNDPDHSAPERYRKVEDAAEDLREEIEDLADDGDLPRDLATELFRLLEPLLNLPGRG